MLVEQKTPIIHKLHLQQFSQAKGIRVFTQVFGVFTRAAYAFGNGVEKIIFVSDSNKAKSLAKLFPNSLTVSNETDSEIHNFDRDDSIWSFMDLDLARRTIIQKISNEHRYPLHNGEKMLAASFAVAEATYSRIHYLSPSEVTFILDDIEDNPQDFSLAEYLESRLNGSFKGNIVTYLSKVTSSPYAQRTSQQHSDYPLSELDGALALDLFPFAMEISRENDLLILKPVKIDGSNW